jgi:hypothetical protein
MQQALEQQSGQRGMTMKVVKSYKTTIRRLTSAVVIEEGEASSAPGATVRELITTFPGKHGTVMLMMLGPKETWDQAVADRFIASIR